MPDPLPEFVASTLAWLATRGVGPTDELRLAHAAQASNGGVLMAPDASLPGVPGLFACGEVAGGMHGTDRVGGLSSAGCLMFGQRAGESAARWARNHSASRAPLSWEPLASALEEVRLLEGRLVEGARPTGDAGAVAETARALWQCRAAKALLASALARWESRGARFRSDFPETNPALARPSKVRLDDARIAVRLG